MRLTQLAVGDRFDFGNRTVRVLGGADGVTVGRDFRNRVAVRNVVTGRLTYIAEARLWKLAKRWAR